MLIQLTKKIVSDLTVSYLEFALYTVDQIKIERLLETLEVRKSGKKSNKTHVGGPASFESTPSPSS